MFQKEEARRIATPGFINSSTAAEMRLLLAGECCRASLTSKIEPDCSEWPFQATAKDSVWLAGGSVLPVR
jgi:hypothetical protein